MLGQVIGAGIYARFLFFSIPIVTYSLGADVEAYALPNVGTTAKIARLYTINQLQLFGFINIFKQLYNNIAFSSGTQLPVDGVPGSVRPFFDVKALQALTDLPKFNPISISIGFSLGPVLAGYVDIYAHNGGFSPEFTFVPVASALDAAPYTTPIFSQKYVNGTNQYYPSTSETFIAQETNTSEGTTNNVHIRFTARNSLWLFNEMENLNNNLNCSNECNNPYFVQGNDLICTNTNYFIPGLQRGATVTWSVSPSGIVNITTTGNTATLTRVNDGVVTLTATISGGCTSSPITVLKNDITVGHKPITGIYYNPNFSTGILNSGQSVCAGTVRLVIDETPQTTYTWQMIYGSAPFTTTNNYVDVTLTQNENVSFSITATNPCGSIGRTINLIADDPSCGGGFYRFSASPNPTTGDVQIKATGATTIKEIQVIDKFGNIKKAIKLSTNPKEHKINIADLPSDTYIIRIYDGKIWESIKVIKT